MNAVGREIPAELLVDGKEVYQEKFYMDGKYVKKDSPRSRLAGNPKKPKAGCCASRTINQASENRPKAASFVGQAIKPLPILR